MVRSWGSGSAPGGCERKEELVQGGGVGITGKGRTDGGLEALIGIVMIDTDRDEKGSTRILRCADRY